MAKRKYQIDSKGHAKVPWHEEYTLADFESREDFEEHLDYMADQWEEVGARLRPGQPHPLAYPQQWEDENYKSDLAIWQHEEAMERQRAKHEPRRESPPMSKEQRAFFHGSGDDKKEAQERLQMRRFIDEQLQDAAEHRAGGRIDKARACEQRAEQYTRSLRKKERTPYSFEQAEETHALQWGEAELDKMVKWSAEELAERFDEIKGMVEGFRQMSPSEHSYTLTGSGPSLRLTKVRHPGIPAKELAARVGEIGDENLLINFKGHGFESREEEPEPPREEPKKSMSEMTAADYQAYVSEQEAKAKTVDMSPQVNPGLFGGGAK